MVDDADDTGSVGSVDNERRKLDDDELEVGEENGIHDGEQGDVDGEDHEELPARKTNVLDCRIGRHPDPKPSDGEVRINGPISKIESSRSLNCNSYTSSPFLTSLVWRIRTLH